tara:strand:+ start:3574 stop:4725 length:1152 start_codon:yes stop_codon:yes gene_type:complete
MDNNLKKIFYWSPCLTKVGTVISAKNSAISLAMYKKSDYEVSIINACGEWDEYLDELTNNGVKIINLSKSYFKYLPKEGYVSSRFSYIVIFLISFFPLLFKLKEKKPDYIIMHLITSLPMLLLLLFKFKTKFILRISGLPKLNFSRKYFWFLTKKKLHKITCPTNELKFKLNKIKIFEDEKIFYLPDAILNLKNFKKSQEDLTKLYQIKNKIILSAGRLTKQKNFTYLINEFSSFLNNFNNYDLVILGEGEERKKLIELINKNNIKDRVHLLGRVSNIYDYMRKAEVFVLSSLWEELGFVIVEAAFNNLFVISSNCPNGPSDFINKNECGILFDNNSKDSLKKALIKFENNNPKENMQKKINAKKKSKIYTKFRHHLELINLF